MWNSEETAIPSVQIEIGAGGWHTDFKMSNVIFENKKDIKILTSGCTPQIYFDFIYLRLWTTTENITDFARNSEKIPSSGTLGIKSPRWLFGNGWKRTSLFSCILPRPYCYSSMYALYGKLWEKKKKQPQTFPSFLDIECSLCLFQEVNLFCECPHNYSYSF